MKTFFKTHRSESVRTWFYRKLFNLFPSYRRGGGRVAFFASDFKEIHVKIGLNLFTRNYVGSVFGGSIFAALDPIYMFLLIQVLGKNYVVWDKNAKVKFIRPITQTVYAQFVLTDELIEQVKQEVAKNGEYLIEMPAVFVDQAGVNYAIVTKELYIADKMFFKNKQAQKKLQG